jgi:beta-lactamase regulating signal transducer with metallopeptidase domain
VIPDAATIDSLAADWLALVIAIVWQSTLLAVGVAAAAWVLRSSSPAVRYWLWQIVAIKILLAPAWTLSVPLAWLPQPSVMRRTSEVPAETLVPLDGQGDSSAPQAIDSQVALDAPLLNEPQHAPTAPKRARSIALPALSWQACLMLAWGAIVLAQLARIAWQRVKLSQLLGSAASADTAIESLVAECARGVRLARLPLVLVTSEECSPFVCGAWHPCIVLPGSLVSELSEAELRPVIVHELAHIKRLDLVWGWIPQLARVLYFFHPVAHWTLFRTRLEAELACDGYAMATTGHGAASYADLLVRVVSRLAEPAMLRTGSAASAGLDGQAPLATHPTERET